MVNEFFVLRKEFIGLIKLLRHCVIKENHLYSTDLEASANDSINYLPYIFILDCVRFNDAESAILAVSFRLNIIISTFTTA